MSHIAMRSCFGSDAFVSGSTPAPRALGSHLALKFDDPIDCSTHPPRPSRLESTPTTSLIMSVLDEPSVICENLVPCPSPIFHLPRDLRCDGPSFPSVDHHNAKRSALRCDLRRHGKGRVKIQIMA